MKNVKEWPEGNHRISHENPVNPIPIESRWLVDVDG